MSDLIVKYYKPLKWSYIMIVDGIDLDDMDNRVLLIVQLVCARGAMCACD